MPGETALFGDDILKSVANNDDMFKFVMDFVDGLPKVYNTVGVALSRIGELGDVDVVGNITSIPDARPVQITKLDGKDKDRLAKLENRVYQFFNLSGGQFNMVCCLHNVVGLNDFPYGKTNDEYSKIIQKLHYAFKNGRLATVIGRYVTMRSDNKEYRILYVSTINIEDDVLTSKMTNAQFKQFKKLCEGHSITPLHVFMDRLFVKFIADDYLKKTIAVFCLSPKSRQEMIHILILTAPGEGKDYMIDTVIKTTVPCGKLESDQQTTVASLVGAMSSNDLSSLGVGVLQKYHHERIAVSEVQTWSSAKFSALLGMMGNGEVIVSKGKLQDVTRKACENVLMAGNIPNHWRPDMDPMEKLDSVMGAKNRQNAKQLFSRITLTHARISLRQRPDPLELAERMFSNIDDDSTMAEGEFFDNDDEIKDICLQAISNREKSRRIRERKIYIMRRIGMDDSDITNLLKLEAWQLFFGQYFKHVSMMVIKVKPVGNIIYRTLESMAKRDEFQKILCNVGGSVDPRKLNQWINLCKAFAKVNGHTQIEPIDISEAESLFKESLSSIIEIGGSIVFSYDLDMVELDILKFIGTNPLCDERELMEHLRMVGSDDMFEKNIKTLTDKNYITITGGRYAVNFTALPDNLTQDLRIERTDISDRDSQLHGMSGEERMDNSMLDNKLDGVEFND